MRGVVWVLLRFRVANYKSIHQVAELSLVSSELKTLAPPDADWARATVRVAGIYGANASGKSTILGALFFMASAVRNSATIWAQNKAFPHHPFLLGEGSSEEPSRFELDLVVDQVRYEYGFVSDREGILEEWLASYPLGRRRKLFERRSARLQSGDLRQVSPSDGFDVAADDTYIFSRELSGENVSASRATGKVSLFLSVAANLKHKTLSAIYHRISAHIRLARFDEMDQRARIHMVRRLLADRPETTAALMSALLAVSDAGISSAELVDLENNSSESDRKLYESLAEMISPTVAGASEEFGDEVAQTTGKRSVLLFQHHGLEGGTYPLTELEESAGTLAWLSLAVPAINAFRYGETLLVDELDASLHPRLSMTLVDLFRNEALNRSGAQLLFTTHDTNLLSPVLGNSLAADEVWFTEKSRSGETELFALSDFPTREAENFGRRYLSGRYGAVPIIDTESLKTVVQGEMKRELDAGPERSSATAPLQRVEEAAVGGDRRQSD
jgi:uncharacterized protein